MSWMTRPCARIESPESAGRFQQRVRDSDAVCREHAAVDGSDSDRLDPEAIPLVNQVGVGQQVCIRELDPGLRSLGLLV
jgi:hypothetical protein